MNNLWQQFFFKLIVPLTWVTKMGFLRKAFKAEMGGRGVKTTIIQGYMYAVPNLNPAYPLTQPPGVKSPPSPLHLDLVDLEHLRRELAPRLPHYARMDPDSFNLSPSRKHNTRGISCHYLDTFMAPIGGYMTISYTSLRCLLGCRVLCDVRKHL